MSTALYRDTRGKHPHNPKFSEAILEGLAQGGGLFVPEKIPQLTLDVITDLANRPYYQQATDVFMSFAPDFTLDEMLELTKKAYGKNFDTDEICPLVSLDDEMHILELWHGPTSAFKDMALQCLPLFFNQSLKIQERTEKSNSDTYLILTATSGDTGKAALEGFRDVENIKIGVFYPSEGVSDIQYRQMVTQEGCNVCVWGVKGDFDDCQAAVKHFFSSDMVKKELHDSHNIILSSANSINWGRLMPQIVYYISSYSRMVMKGIISKGQAIDCCVPTGNFGNILAAYYAREMGVPIRNLICASNENDVLCDFVQTGVYDIRYRSLTKTPSPSMDILVSSNVERLLFELTDRDAEKVVYWMDQLKNKKRFSVDGAVLDKMRNVFKAHSVDNETCLETIRSTYDEKHYLLDPHTAVAYSAAEHVSDGSVPIVIASTAHWAKFGKDVYRALRGLGCKGEIPEKFDNNDCALNESICGMCPEVSIPAGLKNLNDKKIRFTQVLDKDFEQLNDAVHAFLKR